MKCKSMNNKKKKIAICKVTHSGCVQLWKIAGVNNDSKKKEKKKKMMKACEKRKNATSCEGDIFEYKQLFFFYRLISFYSTSTAFNYSPPLF